MKKILMAAVALTALSATPAFAQTASWDVKGSVAAQCGALTGSDLQFNALTINPTDGTLNDSRSISSTSQSVYCNGVNSTITVGASAMTNQSTIAADTADFTGTINYTTDVNFAGTHFAPGAAAQTLGAKAGSLVVTASALTAGTKRPYAGAYVGTISVTLSPAS